MATIIPKTCLFCNTNFNVILRYKEQKFCSTECRLSSIRNPNRPKNIRHQNCITCNNLLTKNTQYKFCNNSCAAIYNNSSRLDSSREQQKNTLINTLTERGLSRTNEKDIYWAQCRFQYWPPHIWHKLPGFELLPQYKMFHSTKNKTGIVRDHILSISDGWKLNINSIYISHPANCRLITNYENIVKGSKSEFTFTQLLEQIVNFNSTI